MKLNWDFLGGGGGVGYFLELEVVRISENDLTISEDFRKLLRTLRGILKF